MQALTSALRLTIGLSVVALAVAVQTLILIVLLPSRNLRIRACNYWGKVVGRILMFLSGSTITHRGMEHLDPNRPAIYACNHSSVFDAFTAMYLAPVGTCGVVKKQIIYYPFFGQMYLMSGHLRIDRSNRETAIASMTQLTEDVKKYGLGIYMWPEGTRSRDGRLLPLKKGIVHMAVATGLPIVPIVASGAHLGWGKGKWGVRPVDVDIHVLPPIDTSEWTVDGMDAHLFELWDVLRSELPEDQQPTAETTERMTPQAVVKEA